MKANYVSNPTEVIQITFPQNVPGGSLALDTIPRFIAGQMGDFSSVTMADAVVDRAGEEYSLNEMKSNLCSTFLNNKRMKSVISIKRTFTH